MDIIELKKQLPGKERSIEDLIRFIKTRTKKDNDPNYSLLLGAGCSISSGINSGQEYINKWRRELFLENNGNAADINNIDKMREHLKKTAPWYNDNTEYSSLFEKRFDLPKQRRKFIEGEVEGRIPSLGYAYLVNLVKENFFKTIFTTNFDDLLNESFYQFSNARPILCAHDSAVSSIAITSSRPKIIKLHGDYLFDDIKSTRSETESLEENIENKFVEFCKEYGLIVVGYSGGDRSVMDVLNYLVKNDDYLGNGLYWCIQKGSDICDEIRKLLWKDRAYYVEIDGFDEIFAQINKEVNGERLPIENNLISNKIVEITKSYLSNSYLTKTTSEIIKFDLQRLEEQTKTKEIFDMVQTQDKDKISSGREFKDQDLYIFMKINNLMRQNDFRKAISLARENIEKTRDRELKCRLLVYILRAHQRLNEKENAILAADEIIQIDQFSPKNYIRRSRLSNSFKEKLSFLDKAIKLDPFYYDSYDEKAMLLIVSYQVSGNSDQETLAKDIIYNLGKSIEIYPMASNPSYNRKFSFIIKSEIDDKEKQLTNLVEELKTRDPNSYQYLDLNYRLEKHKENPTDKILKQIKNVKDNSSLQQKDSISKLYIEILMEESKTDEVVSAIELYEREYKDALEPDFFYQKSAALLRACDDLDAAIKALEDSFNFGFDIDNLTRLISLYFYASRQKEAESLYSKYKGEISEEKKLEIQRDLHEEKGEYGDAIKILDQIISSSIFPDKYVTAKAFLMMKKGDFKEAHDYLKDFLGRVNFSSQYEGEIINYEICRKNLNKQIDKARINAILAHTKDELTRSAAHALLGEKQKSIELLSKAINKNYEISYVVRKWLVYDDIKNEKTFTKIVYEKEKNSGMLH